MYSVFKFLNVSFPNRNGGSRRSSPYSRHDKNHKRHSRSKSKEKYTSSHNYFLEKKANSKRQSKHLNFFHQMHIDYLETVRIINYLLISFR